MLKNREIIPLPEPPATPVSWTARLFRALAENDPALEETARRELRALGVHIRVGRGWRKGVSAQ